MTAASIDGKKYAATSRASGRTWMRSTAEVMKPIVPSLPHSARARSGPVERRGAIRVCTERPSASTAETPTTASSKKPCRALDLPGVRTAMMPPSDDVSTTGG